MTKELCAYIVLTPGLNKNDHFTEIDSADLTNFMVGVSSVEEACEVAKELVAKGVILIELCSGFDEAMARRVYDEIDGAVDVGLVKILHDMK